jgi:hypothetical protein
MKPRNTHWQAAFAVCLALVVATIARAEIGDSRILCNLKYQRYPLQLSGTDASGGTWRLDHWPKGQRFHFGRLDICQEYDAEGKVNTIYYIPHGGGISWEEAQNFFRRNGVSDFTTGTWTAIGPSGWGGTVWASPERRRFVIIDQGTINQGSIDVGAIPQPDRLCILTLEGYINYDWVQRGPDWARLSYQ